MQLKYLVTVNGAVSFNSSGEKDIFPEVTDPLWPWRGVEQSGVLSASLLRSYRGQLPLGDHCRALNIILYFHVTQTSCGMATGMGFCAYRGISTWAWDYTHIASSCLPKVWVLKTSQSPNPLVSQGSCLNDPFTLGKLKTVTNSHN